MDIFQLVQILLKLQYPESEQIFHARPGQRIKEWHNFLSCSAYSLGCVCPLHYIASSCLWPKILLCRLSACIFLHTCQVSPLLILPTKTQKFIVISVKIHFATYPSYKDQEIQEVALYCKSRLQTFLGHPIQRITRPNLAWLMKAEKIKGAIILTLVSVFSGVSYTT